MWSDLAYGVSHSGRSLKDAMCVASVTETHRCQICIVHLTSCRVAFVQIALREAAIAPAVWLGRIAGGNEQWGVCAQEHCLASGPLHPRRALRLSAGVLRPVRWRGDDRLCTRGST